MAKKESDDEDRRSFSYAFGFLFLLLGALYVIIDGMTDFIPAVLETGQRQAHIRGRSMAGSCTHWQKARQPMYCRLWGKLISFRPLHL